MTLSSPLVLSLLGPAVVAVMSSSAPSPPSPPSPPTASSSSSAPPSPPATAPATSLLAAHLAGPGCRLVPAMRRGEVVGVRLFGITPTSPLRAAGLENGDILVAAEGEALTRPEALFRLASLMGPVALTVERRGQRLALEVAAP